MNDRIREDTHASAAHPYRVICQSRWGGERQTSYPQSDAMIRKQTNATQNHSPLILLGEVNIWFSLCGAYSRELFANELYDNGLKGVLYVIGGVGYEDPRDRRASCGSNPIPLTPLSPQCAPSQYSVFSSGSHGNPSCTARAEG